MSFLRTTALMLCLFVSVLPVFSQQVNKPAAKPEPTFDRINGEEVQIKQRVRWFQDRRGLSEVDQPAKKRKEAAAEAKDMRRREAGRRFRASWTEVGPSPMTMLGWVMGRVAGRVSALAVHPTDTDVLYLGAAGGGLWKTTDGGTFWTCLSNDLETQSIGSVFIHPAEPDTIWVGTGEHTQGCTGYFGTGLYKSTDGGTTLVPMNGQGSNTLDLSFISAVVLHPAEENVVLVGGYGYCDSAGSSLPGGIFRSTDGGTNWDSVLAGQVGDLLSDPNDPDVFYASLGRSAASENGIYKSTDAGATWTRLSNGIDTGANVSRMRLVMAPSDANTLYAYGSTGKIFKTTNAGAVWTQTGSNACEGQCWYNLCVAVDPVTPSNLLIGSIRFARSTNSGASQTWLTSTWGGSQKVHQDTHVLLYDKTDPNIFWVGGDGGLWRTNDGGSNFTNLNGNLNITQFYDIAVSPSDHTRVFGGAQDNSSLGTENTLVWDVNFVSGDGFMNLVDPLDTNYVIQTSYPSGNLPNLYRSTTGGGPNSFSWLPQTGLTSGPFPWVTPLEATSNTAQTQSYMFVGSNRVFMSTNRGTSWTDNSGALGAQSLNVIEALPADSRIVVYAGSSGGTIYHTDNALAATPTWTNVTGNYPGGSVTDVAADPSNALRVFVTRGAFGSAQLYRSTTGGTTWDAVGSGLPNIPANAVSIDPIDPNRIFVGTDVGVFESVDGGATFSSMMLGFPLASVVMDLEISETPHVLTAGTYGRGAWRIDLDLGDLLVEVSPDQELCVGDGVKVAATVSNGSNPVAYQWTISSGPDTSLNQLSDTTVATPTFTPSMEGSYVLTCQVTDNLTRVASASTIIHAGTAETYTTAQRDLWTQTSSNPDWDARFDRNGNGLVEILDVLFQISTPRCY